MTGGRARAWLELVRGPAALTVPGDAVAGAAAGRAPARNTALAMGSSLCLYWAGMALNDWADRAEDARDRPHRPLPSGRIAPAAAFGAAAGLTAAGLALAAAGTRRQLATAGALAATVWAYDLKLKHTAAGPAAMGAARGLDLLLGAAGADRPAPAALPPAVLIAAHTAAVTHVSRHEVAGGSRAAPLAALATTAGVAAAVARPGPDAATARGCAASYLLTAAPALARAAHRPTGPHTRAGVVGGLQALVPLQAALAARAGAGAAAPVLLTLLGTARRLSRKVSVT
ncbi:UbiA family prenyltransferase [Streptomyces sp. DSM 44915]|uniref:UbiA family prenyltransferase n=1 Tax=Streptomyces chisholmiae TaxID=3075540 RepID=A0ABU2JL51_9ACTN|nr:UbiA family prenyltransferase [Streptomyces sp. DSM 44915]MDT0265709.1 UbiA family prenyltransferase [Streptomyces sp. DSM 44915]